MPMCNNFIHRALPDNVWLTGAIVKKGKGHIFYRDDSSDLKRLKENLEKAGAKTIVLFEGRKPELITLIQKLNREKELPGFRSPTELRAAAMA